MPREGPRGEGGGAPPLGRCTGREPRRRDAAERVEVRHHWEKAGPQRGGFPWPLDGPIGRPIFFLATWPAGAREWPERGRAFVFRDVPSPDPVHGRGELEGRTPGGIFEKARKKRTRTPCHGSEVGKHRPAWDSRRWRTAQLSGSTSRRTCKRNWAKSYINYEWEMITWQPAFGRVQEQTT